MREPGTIREARVDDAEGFVCAYEAAWDASAGVILDKTLEELMPFESRLEHYRAGVAEAPGDARARRFYEREGWVPGDETWESPLGPA